MITRLDRPEAELKYRSLIKGALYDQPELCAWWLKQVPTPAAFRNLSVNRRNQLANHDLVHLAPMLSAIEAGEVIVKSPREYWGQAYSSQLIGQVSKSKSPCCVPMCTTTLFSFRSYLPGEPANVPCTPIKSCATPCKTAPVALSWLIITQRGCPSRPRLTSVFVSEWSTPVAWWGSPSWIFW